MTRIIALDSALAHTGFAVIEANGAAGDWGVIDTVDPRTSDADHAKGAAAFLRVKSLHDQLMVALREHDADAADTIVAIEETDWSRGRRDSRDSWVIEAGAREALAVGTTTAFICCMELDIQPVVIGPRAWMRQLGIAHKEGAATWCAANWQDRFEIKIKERRGVKRPSVKRVLFDKLTQEFVPDHASDAYGMASVVFTATRERQMCQLAER